MKKCIYFIFAILAMVSISSCSNDDEGGNGTNSITVNGELWNLDPNMKSYFIKYGSDGSTSRDEVGEFNYSFGFFGYVVGKEDETGGPDYGFDIKFLSTSMPNVGDDLTEYTLRAKRYDYTFRYVSGNVIVTDITDSTITIRFENLKMETEDTDIPYYVSKVQTIDNGTLVFDLDIY